MSAGRTRSDAAVRKDAIITSMHPADDRRPRVMVVGAGWRFTSGISYYTCRLTNAFAEATDTSALLMRQLVPTRLYPGRGRVGKPVNTLDYAPTVHVYDGVDWSWGRSMRDAVRFITAERPDVLVLEWWTGAVLHSYLRLAHVVHRYGGRVIIEWHEVQDTGEARIPGVTRYVVAAMRQLLKRVDGHVVHSQYDLELLRRTYPLPDDRLVIAPHGPYDQYDADGAADHEGDFVFLSFGIIRPYKGIEDLVAAFERLPEEILASSRLVIVGETWEGWTAPLDAVAVSPAKDRITVVNRYVDDEEVAAHFAAADAVVLPYRRSSSSGPLHIAMSAGLPVVVSRVGGLVEAAGDYEGARFVPTQDPDALARAMAALPATRGERFADPHSWSHTVDAYGELLERLGARGLHGASSADAPERRGA
jgi:glycosyltransferase involved in cell wall biosynthesis